MRPWKTPTQVLRLDGKDGLSQEHPPREIWNWRAQGLSWETKLEWDSGGVTTREEQGHSQLSPLWRGEGHVQREAETSPRELMSKPWGMDGQR